KVLSPACAAGFRVIKRRGRDLNPRRTKPPETVFETAAFDRSATPPRSPHGQRNRVAHAISRRLPPEPGSARREANQEPQQRSEEEGGNTGETWFPPY